MVKSVVVLVERKEIEMKKEIKIEIKSRFSDSVLFEYTKEENTIKDTLLEAIKLGANLDGANLYGANLDGANLYGANLRGANLDCAYLDGANLRGAYLNGANLYGANLDGANLDDANLSRANLYGANLSRANLYGANLDDANLYRANLYGANLDGANLDGANLSRANLDEKELPRKGYIVKEDFTAYKKCNNKDIVELKIPKGAIVFSINNAKCRTNKAQVVSINGKKGKELITYSYYNESFSYKVGQKIEIEDFDLMYNIECSTGVHFFKTKQEAEWYRF